MAELSADGVLTLSELAHRKDPNGNLATVAEVLTEDNEILLDAVNVEANDTFAHKIVRRSSLPSGSWRKLNAGVADEASQTMEVVEGIGMLESFAQADIDLVMSAPNPMQFRMTEAASFIEGMSQTFATTFFYGNSNTDPEQFTGLAPRMDSLAATQNVIGEGGSGSDVTSVYIVQWNPRYVYLIYPKGSSVGLLHQDLGIETVNDTDGNKYRAYIDRFQWKTVLAVSDPRSIARLANIESAGASNLFDEDNLITLLGRFPMSGRGCVIYANSTVKTQMQIAIKDKTNVNYTADGGDGLSGMPLLRFQGFVVRKSDAIINTETDVS